jgi:hypothetical protein
VGPIAAPTPAARAAGQRDARSAAAEDAEEEESAAAESLGAGAAKREGEEEGKAQLPGASEAVEGRGDAERLPGDVSSDREAGEADAGGL